MTQCWRHATSGGAPEKTKSPKILDLQANSNQHLRTLLTKWQLDDGVAVSKGGLRDPPLLDLEIESAAAEVKLLKNLCSGENSQEMQDEAWCQLLQACSAVLHRFESPSTAVRLGGPERSMVWFPALDNPIANQRITYEEGGLQLTCSCELCCLKY